MPIKLIGGSNQPNQNAAPFAGFALPCAGYGLMAARPDTSRCAQQYSVDKICKPRFAHPINNTVRYPKLSTAGAAIDVLKFAEELGQKQIRWSPVLTLLNLTFLQNLVDCHKVFNE